MLEHLHSQCYFHEDEVPGSDFHNRTYIQKQNLQNLCLSEIHMPHNI